MKSSDFMNCFAMQNMNCPSRRIKKDENITFSSFLLSLVYIIPLISSKTAILVLPEMRGVMEI